MAICVQSRKDASRCAMTTIVLLPDSIRMASFTASSVCVSSAQVQSAAVDAGQRLLAVQTGRLRKRRHL